ncbi:hypothetical protein [Candidatus Palauibacter sp.]
MNLRRGDSQPFSPDAAAPLRRTVSGERLRWLILNERDPGSAP